ncbi:MAG: Rieske (2Fe-2S) protein [Candidatus Dormibacteraceae bacterium]
MARIKVANTADLAPESAVQVTVNEEEVCLARAADGEFYAMRDCCSHEQVLLSEGEVFDSQIECFAHGARFDLRSGEALCLPATEGVKTYPVAVIDEEVFIET